MTHIQSKIGYAGLAFGGAALLLALIHFWAGPFSQQPTIETMVGDKVSSIREAAMNAVKGEEYRQVAINPWDADRIAELTVAIMGALAIILAIVAYVQKAPGRLALGAAALGAGAIGFQMFTLYVGIFLVILLVIGVISALGIDFSF